MAKNTVVVSITANTKHLQNGLKQSQSIMGKLGSVAGVRSSGGCVATIDNPAVR